MTAPRRPDDTAPARDAWLSQALRHAPDARIEAPAQISAAILRAAAAASSHGAPADPRRQRLRAAGAGFWAGLWAGLARPSMATGFASLMVATLVGLLWGDRPIDPLPAEPAVALRADAAPTAAVPAVPAVTAAPIGALQDKRQAETAARDALASTARSEATAARGGAARAKALAPPSAAASDRPTAALRAGDTTAKTSTPRADPPGAADAVAPTRAESGPRADAETAGADIAGRTGAPPTHRPVAIARTTEALEPNLRDLARRASTEGGGSEAATATTQGRAVASAAQAAQAQAPAALSELRSRAATPARAPGADPLRSLRARIDAAPAAWSWQLDAQALQPLDGPRLDWLARLERAASSGWIDAPSHGDPAPSGRTVILLRDDQPIARLTLGSAPPNLTLQDLDPKAAEPARSARLDPAAAAALSDALARLGR